jgi:hypothetical protein
MRVAEDLGNCVNGSYGVSERQLLSLALEKIDGMDLESRKNITEMLVKQLATGVELGHVVCSSGKVARIMSAFDGTDAFETVVKPLWVVREEIGGMAAKIRYEVSEHEAASEFTRRVLEEYCGKLGMARSVIEPIANEYAEQL